MPRWDWTPVTFYRPDGDTEGKDIGWCRSNGFFEIEEGLWSGDWYYRDHPEALKEKKEREATKKKRGRHVYERDFSEAPDVCWTPEKDERRAELLDTMYGGLDTPRSMIEDARKEMAKLEKEEEQYYLRQDPYAIKCAIGGCPEFFLDESAMHEHLLNSKGKAHIRYREEHNITWIPVPKKRVVKTENNPPKADRPKTKKSLPKSADIRSFFKPITNKPT